jgi:hypothetical protein
VELLTPNPGVRHGLGANRPEPTRLRYRRKAERLPDGAALGAAQQSP